MGRYPEGRGMGGGTSYNQVVGDIEAVTGREIAVCYPDKAYPANALDA